ncbi:hypothetical protein [Pseudoduganella namucuonensis]|uniref:Uncharacterized protein n=1 Tax=Pseudoduganella namucuonensis TaxID=1035707 RepID=A0A1I7GRU5_9BURK|nr:hypothetical protein [Pseudoduganella namucuonensis]SFU51168.1 hypothetical protein SAMN05216552_100459 [Pseudoduganella namucuonensis]
MNAPKPANAECRCPLPDGRVLTVTASRRPRANRADVKCAVAGAPALSTRMQEVVRLARHTESRFDSRDQVVLSMDAAPPADERGWELAAVLADRTVRGAWLPPRQGVFAYGWSDAWQLGAVQGRPEPVLAAMNWTRAADGFVVLGEDPSPSGVARAVSHDILTLPHLGALTGHSDPRAAVSSARAWFPLHSGGINDSLSWVEVSVHPADHAGADEEDTIAVSDLALTAQLAVRQVLAAARHFDGRGLGRWRTVVRFGQPRFQGASYELALVMADRLARGRECVPRGRVIASGCSSAWHAGRVDAVEGLAAKMELILKQAAPGDRVLLPKDGEPDADPAYADALRAKGASLARIERIGMI